MKKFKIYLVAMLAIVIAVAGSAYSVNHGPKKTETTYYYKYIGTGTTNQDLLTESNWEEVINPTVTGCNSPSGVNCVIEVTSEPDEFHNPDLEGLGIDTRGELNMVTVTFKD